MQKKRNPRTLSGAGAILPVLLVLPGQNGGPHPKPIRLIRMLWRPRVAGTNAATSGQVERALAGFCEIVAARGCIWERLYVDDGLRCQASLPEWPNSAPE